MAFSRYGICRGLTHLFFASDDEGRAEPGRQTRVAKAKAVCAVCPVQMECREYAIENEIVGIWGGWSERRRREERQRRKMK